MKILYAILLLSLTYSVTSAQKIYFTDTTNEWNYHYAYWGVNKNVRATYNGDSIIHGKEYFKLEMYNNSYWVREDTAKGKVYVILDSADHILYDYSMSIGDTLYKTYPPIQNAFKILTAVDSFQMDSIWYKIQYFAQGTSWDFTVIEGIGCMQAIDFPLYYAGAMKTERILCFSNNGKKPVFSKIVQKWFNGNDTPPFAFDNTSSCDLKIHVAEIEDDNNLISIYPHPATQNSIISIDEQIEPDRLVITNITGQVISNKGISDTHTIPLGETIIHPGNYFYVLTDISGNIYRGRFVYQ